MLKKEGRTIYTVNGRQILSDSQHPVILPRGCSYSWICEEPGLCQVIQFDAVTEDKALYPMEITDNSRLLTAFDRITKALAKELGPSGITVNCVEPGVIDTDMNSMLDENAMKELAEATPLCRIGKSEEVAAVIGFLASKDASFITGACIPVDGGFPV